jgi:hypothetical protein
VCPTRSAGLEMRVRSNQSDTSCTCPYMDVQHSSAVASFLPHLCFVDLFASPPIISKVPALRAFSFRLHSTAFLMQPKQVLPRNSAGRPMQHTPPHPAHFISEVTSTVTLRECRAKVTSSSSTVRRAQSPCCLSAVCGGCFHSAEI